PAGGRPRRVDKQSPLSGKRVALSFPIYHKFRLLNGVRRNRTRKRTEIDVGGRMYLARIFDHSVYEATWAIVACDGYFQKRETMRLIADLTPDGRTRPARRRNRAEGRLVECSNSLSCLSNACRDISNRA